MKTRNLVIICLTFLLFFGGLTFALWSENISENPYEQCLESCVYSDKITCTRICTEEFKEAIEMIADKFIPLLEEVIKQDVILGKNE